MLDDLDHFPALGLAQRPGLANAYHIANLAVLLIVSVELVGMADDLTIQRVCVR